MDNLIALLSSEAVFFINKDYKKDNVRRLDYFRQDKNSNYSNLKLMVDILLSDLKLYVEEKKKQNKNYNINDNPSIALLIALTIFYNTKIDSNF